MHWHRSGIQKFAQVREAVKLAAAWIIEWNSKRTFLISAFWVPTVNIASRNASGVKQKVVKLSMWQFQSSSCWRSAGSSWLIQFLCLNLQHHGMCWLRLWLLVHVLLWLLLAAAAPKHISCHDCWTTKARYIRIPLRTINHTESQMITATWSVSIPGRPASSTHQSILL